MSGDRPTEGITSHSCVLDRVGVGRVRAQGPDRDDDGPRGGILESVGEGKRFGVLYKVVFT